ncbi:MAG TPA: DinB family protein [Thermoanaerobaculia bacterium]|nr:DinB family protein [Thermoanaerobaculia bacterium]
MSTREHFVKCFQDEKPRFVRVLRAVPADKAGYRPHEKSASAGGLVWLLASELSDACKVVDHGKVDFVMPPEPPVGQAVAAYERNAGELEKRLAKLDDAAWGKNAKFVVDGNVAWETTLGEMLWGFLFDAIHHRGQLSTYLRPMGAKVPSIYGPSGDDPGM